MFFIQRSFVVFLIILSLIDIIVTSLKTGVANRVADNFVMVTNATLCHCSESVCELKVSLKLRQLSSMINCEHFNT